MALLRFKTAYRQADMILADDELPDHLGVLLEFGATADVAGARTLLLEHRAGLELLRLALEDAHSPWAHVLQAVSATMPPLAGDDREAVMKLAAQGPPAEEVGLAPFAPPDTCPGSRWQRRQRQQGLAALTDLSVSRQGSPVMTVTSMTALAPASGLDIFLWVVFPSICLTVFAVGHFWRYRYDKFGWTTRSSPAVRESPAAPGQSAVPLRHSLRPARSRHGSGRPQVVDRVRRDL